MAGPIRARIHRPTWPDSSKPDEPSTSALDGDVEGPSPPVIEPEARTDSDALSLLAGAVFVMAMLGFVAGGLLWRAEMLAGLIVAPILALLTLPLARAARSAVSSFDAGALLMLGLGAKLLGVQARYYVIEGVYNGVGDSSGYHGWGLRLGPQFRELDFIADVNRPILGTGFLRYLTGLVYAVVGSNQFVGFLVFGFLAFLGLVLMFRAFCLAVPDGDHRRYGLLLFLWPSLIFWPASIGKESWMLLCLGLTLYGIARVLVVRPGGFVLMALGLSGMVVVRPHVGILVAAALVPAYFLRRGSGMGALGPVSKAVGLVVLLVGFSLIAAQAERFFGFEDLTTSSLGDALERTEQQTTTGGSAYEPVVVRNPLQYPWAVVTVLVRPFPTEADNGQMLFTSLEGFALIALIAFSVTRTSSFRATLTRRPYVAFALVYVGMFCFAFAAMGNFGILARQRVQVLPLLFVLLAVTTGRSATPTRASSPRFPTVQDRSD